ncbi:hypothetical protein GQ53DRAFT_84689 [Thozetella sp. PMI_491]|nr:hypothetical protein GQ53DRAFT_84689 [Thozetella sp. PMI_491]
MSMSPPVHRCPRCMREFARAEHLVRHERTHTKEKPYRCGLCSQAFSRQDLLRRHDMKAHGRGVQADDVLAGGAARLVTRSSLSRRPEVSPRQNAHLSRSRTAPRLANIASTEDISSSADIFPVNMTDPPGMWTSELMPDVLPAAFLGSPLHRASLADTFGWLDGSQPTQPLVHAGLDGFDITDAGQILADFNAVASRSYHEESPQAQSNLSRHSSIPDLLANDDASLTAITPLNDGDLTLTEERWRLLEQQALQLRPCSLPSRDALCGFITRYFNSFHRHQPFLHEPTWSPNDAPTYLLLAVCANGAVYSLENTIAIDLFHLAADMLPQTGTGLCVLQAMMLLTAFASWSGEVDDLQFAVQLQGRMALAVRREWALLGGTVDDTSGSWLAWLARESLKRITCCIFTVTTLMAVAFDLPPALSLECEYGLPSQENLWCTTTEDEWIQLTRQTEPQQYSSADEIIQSVFDPELPIPSRIGMFSCHVVIVSLLQKILFFQRSLQGCEDAMLGARQRFLLALKRWQLMWESEPEASLSPDHPRGPILFNCTAILRLAYIRLVAYYAPIRRAFTFLSSSEHIAARLDACVGPRRDAETAMAALQACLALRIPTQMGFKVIARTSFWVWSVQHALSYFECALLLSQWLQETENVPSQDQSPDERGIITMVEQILSTSKPNPSGQANSPLSIAILLRWAELLDTGDTTVWGIMPGMARVLRVRAEMVSAARQAVSGSGV